MKYINAETFDGAMYGCGVVHARDRLWQMYFFRYLAQGRLSEVKTLINEILFQLVGKDILEVDILVRNVGLPKIAKRMAAKLGPVDLQM